MQFISRCVVQLQSSISISISTFTMLIGNMFTCNTMLVVQILCPRSQCPNVTTCLLGWPIGCCHDESQSEGEIKKFVAPGDSQRRPGQCSATHGNVYRGDRLWQGLQSGEEMLDNNSSSNKTFSFSFSVCYDKYQGITLPSTKTLNISRSAKLGLVPSCNWMK